MERLQKYLARADVASRRRAEELIREGRVKVNGKIVTEMGIKIDSAIDTVTLDGRNVIVREEKVYFILNKPVRVVTTLDDPQKRVTVAELLKGIKTRVYPVGRLDYLTEGLLLLTNDGELAYRLTHPKFKVDKIYVTRVKGVVQEKELKLLRRGVLLEDGITAPAKVKLLEKGTEHTYLEIVISEGRNRQVRRMCEMVGHPVLSLKRIQFGPLSLGSLLPGQYRHLNEREVKAIKKACRLI